MFPITASIKGGAVGNVCKSLLKRGLIEEIQASDLNTVWRHDEELGSITLRATPLAYSALGITEDAEEAPAEATRTAPKIERSKGGKQATQVRGMLGSPEVVARALEGLQNQAVISEEETIQALTAFGPVWDELFPAEQARVIRLLIDTVSVRPETLEVTLRAQGLHSLISELHGHERSMP